MLRGLRSRFVVALVLVSALTLGVTAAALFSPLKSQLRTDELDGLAHAVRAQRGTLDRLTAADALTASSPRLRLIARSLRRSTGAEVSVFGPTGRLLFATDPDLGKQFPEVRQALRTGTQQRNASDSEGDARLAVPLVVDEQTRIVVELRKPLNNLRGAVRVVRDAFLTAAAISLVVALLAGLLLADRLVRRLRGLRDTALLVAELGIVAEVRSDNARDEVGDLTRAFAAMQQRLREQEQARRTFVATASHELRTPLTSLRVMLDMLREDLDSQTPDLVRAREQARRADGQAERLSQLAAELLDLSRIDAGLPLRAELVETGEVVRSVVAEFEVRLAETGRTITVDAGDTRWAIGDPGSVAQIVRVLIDNALRHTAPPSPVRVTVGGNGEALIHVSDEGPGVSAQDADRIFERFERGASTTGTPGFGLGLAIARELARRMNGDLRLGASAGSGATFELALPAAPDPSAL